MASHEDDLKRRLIGHVLEDLETFAHTEGEGEIGAAWRATRVDKPKIAANKQRTGQAARRGQVERGPRENRDYRPRSPPAGEIGEEGKDTELDIGRDGIV